jgi:predicted GNAT family N-acyltransferase
MADNVSIAQMTRDEFNVVVSWAEKEGWNPGVNDADIFWKTDPDGYIAMKNDNNELIGSGSIISYNRKFGFMGFFIIKPEYRDHGLGKKLWYYRLGRLLERLDKDAPVGMDGVFSMQGFYAKGGFKFSHRNLRMEGNVLPGSSISGNIKPAVHFNFNEILEYDTRHFGFPRKNFIKLWIDQKGYKTYGYDRSGNLAGFGTIRKCIKGYKIGPLFADSFEIADEIFKKLVSEAEGNYIYLDIPEINPEAVRLASKYNLKECFGCARMYYGKTPELPYRNIFGVTTFELG